MQYKHTMPVKYQTELVLKAAEFAAEAHAFQKRKTNQEPYINHLLRVAHHVAEAGLSENAIVAAILHDVAEDTDTTFEDLEKAFPSRVVELVRLLTQWWPDDAPPELKAEEAPQYYRAILKDKEAIAIKLLDRADNLNDMALTIRVAPRWAARYLKKSLIEMAPLLEKTENEAARSACQNAMDRLQQALRNFSRSEHPAPTNH